MAIIALTLMRLLTAVSKDLSNENNKLFVVIAASHNPIFGHDLKKNTAVLDSMYSSRQRQHRISQTVQHCMKYYCINAYLSVDNA